MKKPKTVALIPLRGGSKSIKLKNIKEINGKPLFYWALNEAEKCEIIDRVYVSTDSEIIKDSVQSFNLSKTEVINRSDEVSTDTASTESVMLEFANKVDFDYIVLIQATSPLIEEKYIREGLYKIFNGEADSIFSYVIQKRFIWSKRDNSFVPLNYFPNNRHRRQDFEGFIVENGAFYITSKEALINSGCRISGKILGVEMPEETYYEIDEPTDWIVVEHLLKSRYNSKYKLDEKLKQIKAVFFDCDGVLTDGGMYYSENGDELKRFNTKDGMAIKLLKEKNVVTAIITGENVELVRRRGQKLKVDEIILGSKEKIEDVLKLCNKYNLKLNEIAYIGDDINDIEVIKKIGIGFAVKDAISIVKKHADHVLESKGGEGALREVAEIILEYIGTNI